jgi:hypothetical protein
MTTASAAPMTRNIVRYVPFSRSSRSCSTTKTPPSPRLATRPRKMEIVSASATRPKSSGTSSRARTTVPAIWTRRLPASVRNVQGIPRMAFSSIPDLS